MSPVSKSSPNHSGNQRLAFTLYHILHELDPEKTGYLTNTRFNKIAYLIHQDIKKNLGLNTGLPWHWYLFGSVVALEYCPTDVYVKQELGHGNWRVFYGKEPRKGILPVGQQRRIVERIEYWRDKYLKTEDAIDLAYSEVEIPFIKEIKRFSDLVTQSPGGLGEQITPFLDGIMVLYPEEHLKDLAPLYLRLDNVLRLVSGSPTTIRNYADLIEDFRKLTLLKLGVTVSENMPQSWILEQSDKFLREKERFQIEFDDLERKVLCAVKEEKDRTGYAKKLMEISWETYSEG